MTDFINDDCNDASLDIVESNANALHLCSGDPTTRAQAITNSLGNYVVDGTDYTKADGDTSGRKLTCSQQTGNNATASGTGAVVCHIDATRLLWKADLAATQVITSGNPFTINAHDWEIRDPT